MSHDRHDQEFEYESTEDRQVADWLDAAAAVPAAGFRGALGRYLRRRDPGYGPRPPRLRAMSIACVGGGGVLLFLAALQAVGGL